MFEGISPAARAWLLVLGLIIAGGGSAAMAAAVGGASIGWAIIAGLAAGFGQLVTALMKSPTEAKQSAADEAQRAAHKLPLWILAGTLALSLTACMTLNKATITLTSVVDSAMKNWAAASDAGQTSAELDAKVFKAHEHYRKVCADLVPIYELAKASGDQPSADRTLQTLRNAVDPLLNLITPLLTADQSRNLNLKLERANAP